MITKLSTGCTGSATRGMSEFDREVETRMSNRKSLDMFTDEFYPPYSSETFPGADFTKRSAPYQARHDIYTPESDPQFWDKSIRAHPEKGYGANLKKHMHAAGDFHDQEKMDWLDEREHRFNAGIKPERDQFPGALKESIDQPLKTPYSNPFDKFEGKINMKDHAEIAGFDKHQTDPATLSKGETKMTPFKSQAQRGFMYTHHPKIAEEFEKKTPPGKLPYHKQTSAPQEDRTNLRNPEQFDKEVEKRMKRLTEGKVVEDPKTTKEPKWDSDKNIDQEMCK